MIAWLIGYVILGVAAAAMSMLAIDDLGAPDGSEPAIAFLVGVLWPVVVAGAVVVAIWCAMRAVGRGFAVLWRHAGNSEDGN